MKALRTLLVVVLTVLMTSLAHAADAPWDIEQLMQALAKVNVGRADFVETKTIEIGRAHV